MKVLISRACEIASYEDLDKPLQELDPEFTGTVAKVLENLKNWKQIEPVKTYLIEEDYKITGLGVRRHMVPAALLCHKTQLQKKG